MKAIHRNKNGLLYFLIPILLLLQGCNASNTKSGDTPKFNIQQDLLLLHYDFKTDVDDLHSAAAFGTLLSHPDYKTINYHAVAGTYGTQTGLYVPPNELCQLIFDNNWSDADQNFKQAILEVKSIALKTIEQGGDIWIADGGQSDFSAALGKAIQSEDPILDVKTRIHVVQHSDWNEKVTSPEALTYVKVQTDYQKIPDGNEVGNGTPGFRSEKTIAVNEYLSDPHLLSVWQLAADLGNQYNGKEGRYLNEAVAAGGLDFSDFSEVCWILELEDLVDGVAFFEWLGKK
ncbi:MAG: hypothetical protein Sapg2KO_14090 [Saprospiraceae bacterium]